MTVADEAALTEEEAFGLLVYLVSAAELAVLEPELYGSFRLVDAASRLLSPLAERASPPARRTFYKQLKEEIDRNKVLMMWDKDSYVEFLRRLPGDVTNELKRRRAADEARGSES